MCINLRFNNSVWVWIKPAKLGQHYGRLDSACWSFFFVPKRLNLNQTKRVNRTGDSSPFRARGLPSPSFTTRLRKSHLNETKAGLNEWKWIWRKGATSTIFFFLSFGFNWNVLRTHDWSSSLLGGSCAGAIKMIGPLIYFLAVKEKLSSSCCNIYYLGSSRSASDQKLSFFWENDKILFRAIRHHLDFIRCGSWVS